MKSGWMMVVVIGAVSLVGCVSQKKYEEAMVDVDSAKFELERTRTQKNALEQQVKTLKDLNVKFVNEAQVAHDELERIQHGRDKERGSGCPLSEGVERSVALGRGVLGAVRVVCESCSYRRACFPSHEYFSAHVFFHEHQQGVCG
jgi:outer membrane murein-binding lipoprotein Lpp